MHWYINDPVASITRPIKELKHFEKKAIAKGQSVMYELELDPMESLSFPNAKGERILESGDFYLIVGDQRVKFELVD